jgi:hypothetical protein
MSRDRRSWWLTLLIATLSCVIFSSRREGPSFPLPWLLPMHPVPSTDLSAISPLTASNDTARRRMCERTIACSGDITSSPGRPARAWSPMRTTHAWSALGLRTPSGRSHKLVAPTIVLASGELGTPRLLSASHTNRSCGPGNEHDRVGRFYMTHLEAEPTMLALRASPPPRMPLHSTSI